MSIFFFILTHNIIPIFILILSGIYLDYKFKVNVSTLTKINLYVFVPAFVFVNVYTTTMPKELLKIFLLILLMLILNLFIGRLYGKIRGFDKGLTNAFSNSIMFYNSGNIGIPLITLVYSSKPYLIDGQTPYLDFALTVQIIVLIIQNVTTNSLGVFNVNHAMGWKKALRKALSMPAVYFIAMAFILKSIPYDLTEIPFWPAFTYAKDALIAIALLTLGVQLSQTKWTFKNPDVYGSMFLRLIGGPLLAVILIKIFGLNGIPAQVVMISSSVPTAVNTALLGIEFDNHPEFATQAVMFSTVLCSVTLTGVIYLAGILFPV